MLERLVLKSPIQRTSQRVKWTSGAQDMIFLFPGDHRGGPFFSLISKPWLETMGEGAFCLEMISFPEMLKAGVIL